METRTQVGVDQLGTTTAEDLLAVAVQRGTVRAEDQL